MRAFFRNLLRLLWKLSEKRPSPEVLNERARSASLERRLSAALPDTQAERYRMEYAESLCELIEARQMAGSGPWVVSDAALAQTDKCINAGIEALRKGTVDLPLRESPSSVLNVGSQADIELALSNVEWRREINLSWLEFSRWGIQQIILMSRLYWLKNPIVRRLTDICAVYVFGRGFEVSSEDPDANDVLKDFFERNRAELGQTALTQKERNKSTDGNIFFCLFEDTVNKGKTKIRTIDATEIQDIVTDPDDSDTPWYYRRKWTQKIFDPENGTVKTESADGWYPARGYNPPSKPKTIGDVKVHWEAIIHHRKVGAVSKWHFGCPRMYPVLDWAKASRRYLESCATTAQALAQIALQLTTKGGQQAIQGVKSQLETTVGPATNLWDENPPPVTASIFVSGPGTTLQAFKTQGAGQDPEKVRRFLLMCCMCIGVPETFTGDVSTGNLATATTLDRPTELLFLSFQEEWREDLIIIAKEVLKTSLEAPNGKLREAMERRNADLSKIVVMEGRRKKLPDGRFVYATEKTAKPEEIQVRVTFPAIREGDIPALVGATSTAMTLGGRGQVTGIDEREGVRILGQQLGIDDVDEMVEAMYPDSEYDPDRTKEPPPPPIPNSIPQPGEPQNPGGEQVPPNLPRPGVAPPKTAKEALTRLVAVIQAIEAKEATNGTHAS